MLKSKGLVFRITVEQMVEIPGEKEYNGLPKTTATKVYEQTVSYPNEAIDLVAKTLDGVVRAVNLFDEDKE